MKLTNKTKLILKYTLSAILVLVIGTSIGWNYTKKRYIDGGTGVKISLSEDIPQPLEKFEDFGITIEKLKISSPIIPEVDGLNENTYYGALKNGVAQFKGSSTPDKEGNIFIFGHSSFFKGVSGKYLEIFKQLNELKENDEFVIYYNKIPYRYKITKSYLTNDQDWSLVDPTPDDKKDKTATLMTCYPPGTVLKRWAIIANQL